MSRKRQASGDFEAETKMVFFQASRRMAIDLVGLGDISDCLLSGLSWLRVGRVLSASKGLIEQWRTIRSIVGYRRIYAGCTLAEPRRGDMEVEERHIGH